MLNGKVHLVECPRDAMQGWKQIIPAEKKIQYLNSLLKVGFDTLDYGSFVSAAAIPQMADTAEVTSKLDMSGTNTRLLAIIANRRGAEEAAPFAQISYLGFPFSVSETFQQRNTKSSMEESLARVNDIQEICTRTGKELVIYISMGFGNPYGDPYTEDLVYSWVKKFHGLGINIISVADTVGLATAAQVRTLISKLTDAFPSSTIGVHLHSSPQNQVAKIEAAFQAGCRRFDGAIHGIGGCPMANDELVGNMNSEIMIRYFSDIHALASLNNEALAESIRIADEIFKSN